MLQVVDMPVAARYISPFLVRVSLELCLVKTPGRMRSRWQVRRLIERRFVGRSTAHVHDALLAERDRAKTQVHSTPIVEATAYRHGGASDDTAEGEWGFGSAKPRRQAENRSQEH